MMVRRSHFVFFAAGAFLLLGFVFFHQGLASSPFDIEFPIPELANCADKEQCKVYCDDLSHKTECLAFAKQHGLIAQDDREKAERLPEAGPGGCESESACRQYCESPDHLEECVQFATLHGFMQQEEAEKILEQSRREGPGGCKGDECRTYCDDQAHATECLEYARKEGLIPEKQYEIAKRVVEGGGPGGCRSENECRAYCQDPAHLEACLEFAESQGFVGKEEAARIKKLGITEGPGGCKFEECRVYCDDPAHRKECIDFGERAGLMTSGDATRARKIIDAVGPGGCRGEECREYCNAPGREEECLDFAIKQELMPPEEADRARKFLRVSQEGGPGGCRGIECRDYCADPMHQEVCLSFAKDKELIPPDQLVQFEAGMKIQKKMQESGGPGGCRNDEECRRYCLDPSHVEECVAFGAAHGGLSDEEIRRMLKEFTEGRFEAQGDFGPPDDFQNFEEDVFKRFEEFRQLEGHFRGGFPEGFAPPSGFVPPGGILQGSNFSGPGGCATPDECIKYCVEHKEECFHFAPAGTPSGFPPSGAGDFPASGYYPQIRSGLAQPSSFMSLRRNPEGKFYLLTVDADGIKEFSLTPETGSRYAGEVPGCPKEYKTDVSFSSSDFPLTGYMIDCKDNRFETSFTYEQATGKEGIMPSQGHPAPPPGAYPSEGGYDFFHGIEPVPGTNGVFGPIEGPVPGTYPPPSGTYPYPAGTSLPYDPKSHYCPAMPTVDQCPPGYRKDVVFNSPECGIYYGCVPDEHIQESPYPSNDDPARACQEKGGVWDGSTCKFPNYSPAPSGEPYPQYSAPPTSSDDPTVRCREAGGTWDGSICVFPSSTQGLARKGFFATLIEFLFGW